ncbi:dihydrolipoyl dehydrogenase, partial [Francisella tularensis subsp. holarctica]|nr:dihydrolipoyl dehydrogenase [Francisella tularensis subsp. holarctica]
DPSFAWVGETVYSPNAKVYKYDKGVFPWAACGCYLSIDRSDGITKILFDVNINIIAATIVCTKEC